MKTKNLSKLNQNGFTVVEAVILVVVVVVIAAGGWLVYDRHHHKTPIAVNAPVKKVAASTVINEFNQAVGSGDQAKVLLLESSAFKSSLEKGTTTLHSSNSSAPITNNYYTFCTNYLGQLCSYEFNSSTLAKDKVTTSAYANPVGVKGVTETFTSTTTVNQPDESGSSSTSFSVSAVPDGNTWLIDSAGDSPSASVSL